jgi:hypothetical protein
VQRGEPCGGATRAALAPGLTGPTVTARSAVAGGERDAGQRQRRVDAHEREARAAGAAALAACAAAAARAAGAPGRAGISARRGAPTGAGAARRPARRRPGPRLPHRMAWLPAHGRTPVPTGRRERDEGIARYARGGP